MSSSLNNARSSLLAEQYEAAHDEFVSLLESLTEQQWHLIGKNYPQRINEEDEGRTVGVIAHHVATNGDYITERIQTMLAGGPLAPINQSPDNSENCRLTANAAKEQGTRLV